MIVINAECREGHQHLVSVDRSKGIRFALDLAELMDGTSPTFAHPPGPTSPIGKCRICGSQITCTVTDEDDPLPPLGNVAPPTVDPSSEEFKRGK